MKHPLNRRTASGVDTDLDGRFGLPANIGDTLEVKYVGYESQKIIVTEGMRDVTITLVPDDNALLGGTGCNRFNALYRTRGKSLS